MVAAAINVALGVEPDLTPTAEHKAAAIHYFTPMPGRVVSINKFDFSDCPDVYDSEIYVKSGDLQRNA